MARNYFPFYSRDAAQACADRITEELGQNVKVVCRGGRYYVIDVQG